MITVVTVLKTGGEYTHEHVFRLWQQLVDHLRLPFVMVCLTDDTTPFVGTQIQAQKLQHRLPGWWSKMELFRLPQALYLDLDTTILGDFSDMLTPRSGFWALRDFMFKAPSTALGSGLMYWNGDYSRIYNRFMSDPVGYMNRFRRGGDQAAIKEMLHEPAYFWQDHFPGRVVSYKLGVLRGEADKRASILCFHGQPRPWGEVDNEAINRIRSVK